MNNNDPSIASPSIKNSRTGVFSLFAGGFAIFGAILSIAIIRFDWFPDVSFAFSIVLAVLVVLLTLLGIGAGIRSLFQKGSRKLFGILGFVLNIIVFISLCLFPAVSFFQTNGFPPRLRDGCILGTAKVWLDQNQDGIWDSNEYPLSEVQVVVYDGSKNYDFIREDSTTNNRGEALVGIWPYTCDSLDDKVQVTIQATPPKGYEATTSTQIVVTSDDLSDLTEQDYFFGFIRQTSP